MCCQGRRLRDRHRARSTRAALACRPVRATVWREAAHVLPEMAAVGPPSCSLDAGCAGFYANARHGTLRMDRL